MNNIEKILIFGGTGFIGSHLILQYLLEGNIELFCYVDLKEASSNEFQPRNQITQAVLKAAEMGDIPKNELLYRLNNINIVTGKRSAPMLGISVTDLQSLKTAGIHHIWHADSLYNNHEFYEDDIIDYNVTGTKNIIDLASFIQALEFNYISFNHIGSKLTGEDDSYSRSYYENSIQKSEEIILSRNEQQSLHVRIFRASIPIGNSKTCNSNFSSTLYDYILDVDWFIKWVSDRVQGYFTRFPIKIFKGQKTGINIVPINYMVNKMISLATQKNRSPETHRIESPNAIPIEALYRCIKQSIPGFNYEFVENVEELCSLDKMMQVKLENYDVFFTSQNEVDSSGETDFTLSIPKLSQMQLQSFIDNFIARNNQFKKNYETYSKTLFDRLEKNEIQCRFGNRITYYTSRNSGPTVVFITPSACTHEIWRWIIPKFHNDYNIVVSHFRGLDTIISEQTGNPVIFGSQESANDIVEILSSEKIEKAHVVGFCAGAEESLILYSNATDRVASLTLIAGEYTTIDGNTQTQFTKDVYEMFDMLLQEPSLAPIFVNTISTNSKKVTDVNLRNMVLFSNPKYNNILINFARNEKYLVNYSIYSKHRIDKNRLAEIITSVEIPTLLLSGKNDTIVDHSQSVWASNTIQNSKHYSFSVGTHFIPIENCFLTSKLIKSNIENQYLWLQDQ